MNKYLNFPYPLLYPSGKNIYSGGRKFGTIVIMNALWYYYYYRDQFEWNFTCIYFQLICKFLASFVWFGSRQVSILYYILNHNCSKRLADTHCKLGFVFIGFEILFRFCEIKNEITSISPCELNAEKMRAKAAPSWMMVSRSRRSPITLQHLNIDKTLQTIQMKNNAFI